MADENEPKRTKSGNHPAVVDFRARLKELKEEGGRALDGLDKVLSDYVAADSEPPRRVAGSRG